MRSGQLLGRTWGALGWVWRGLGRVRVWVWPGPGLGRVRVRIWGALGWVWPGPGRVLGRAFFEEIWSGRAIPGLGAVFGEIWSGRRFLAKSGPRGVFWGNPGSGQVRVWVGSARDAFPDLGQKKGTPRDPDFWREGVFLGFFELPIPLIFTQNPVSPGLRPKNMKSGIWHFFFETEGAGIPK